MCSNTMAPGGVDLKHDVAVLDIRLGAVDVSEPDGWAGATPAPAPGARAWDFSQPTGAVLAGDDLALDQAGASGDERNKHGRFPGSQGTRHHSLLACGHPVIVPLAPEPRPAS